MAKQTFAVYDSDSGYVSGFLAYFRGNPIDFLDFIGFSDLNSLEKYLKDHRVSCLLFSEEDLLDRKDAEPGSGRFTEHDHVDRFIYLGGQRNSRCQVKHINKYQSMARIRREILTIASENEEQAGTGGPGVSENRTSRAGEADSEVEILGIYAAELPAARERFSLCLAEMLSAEKGAALYVSLDRFSLLHGSMESQYHSVMADLLYLFSMKQDTFGNACREKIYRQGSSWFLTASPNQEDLETLSVSAFMEFLSRIAAACGCRYLVLDMGEAFRNLPEVFSRCRHIYLPVPETSLRGIRTTLLLQYLSSAAALSDRISVISAKFLSAEDYNGYPGIGAGASAWVEACREGEFAQMIAQFIRGTL